MSELKYSLLIATALATDMFANIYFRVLHHTGAGISPSYWDAVCLMLILASVLGMCEDARLKRRQIAIDESIERGIQRHDWSNGTL